MIRAESVRVEQRADQGGVRLYLGLAGYRAIGSPARVDLVPEHQGFMIRHGTQYAIAGVAHGGQPRIAIGSRAAAALGIPNASAEYAADHSVLIGYLYVVLGEQPAPLTGADLVRIRHAAGETQAAMAAYLGAPYGTYCNWEQRRRVPFFTPAQRAKLGDLIVEYT